MPTRLTALDPSKATGRTKELLDRVQHTLGMTPNLFRTFANSPAVLEGYLAFSSALAGGSLDVKLREQIALAVADANGCEYCLSAHTAIGRRVGLDQEDLDGSRRAMSGDPKVAAALRLARQIVQSGADVTDADVRRVRDVGYTEGDVAEIIANVALNIFTNYFNHIAQTEVDFPRAGVEPTAAS